MSGVRGGDVEILANKLATAQHFTSVVASRGVPYGQDQLSTVKGIMSDITSSASSLAIAKAALEDYIFTLDPNYDIDVANFTSKEILDVVNSRVNFPTGDDIYTYRLDAGIEYIFEFSGVNDSNNSLTEPWLGVYDSDGTWLETNSNVNQVNRIFFTPPHTTDYHISVRSLDSTEIGAYSLLSDWVGNDTRKSVV